MLWWARMSGSSPSYDRPGAGSGSGSWATPSAPAPGKRTRTQGLAVQRKPAEAATPAPGAQPAPDGAQPGAQPLPASAAGSATAAPAGDPFGLHLLGGATALSPASIRTIQVVLRNLDRTVPVNGQWDAATAAAFAKYQQAHTGGTSGAVDDATLDVLRRDLVAAEQRDFALALIVDHHHLDGGDVLALRINNFADGRGTPADDSTLLWEGNLRVISVYWNALDSMARTRATIAHQKAQPPPAVATTPVPKVLAPAAEQHAVASLAGHLQDAHALMALQDALGAPPTAHPDAETVQRLAAWQGGGDGVLDPASAERLIMDELAGKGRHESAIRVALDYHDISDHGALASVTYDPMLGAMGKSTEAETSPLDVDGAPTFHGPTASTIRLGPKAFRSYAELIQTLRHETEHVRQNRDGDLSKPAKEFDGEAIELLQGPPGEPMDIVCDDGARAIDNWEKLSPAEKHARWKTFVAVRQVVREAFHAIPAEEREGAAPPRLILVRYNEVTKPIAPR